MLISFPTAISLLKFLSLSLPLSAQMDAFDFDNVKAEKAKAMRRYNRLRITPKLFRLGEICVAFALLTWIAARLPLAVRISGLFFRQLIAVVVSPLFIFVVGNAIVITLLAKSGQLSGRIPAIWNTETDIYEEFVKNNGSEINYELKNYPPLPETEEIAYQDEQIISEDNSYSPNSNDFAIVADKVSDAKAFRRSRSENLKRESSDEPRANRRRSETEKFQKVGDSGEVPPESVNLVDKLSNGEFKRFVEEFIARQVKFHQEENLAIVTS